MNYLMDEWLDIEFYTARKYLLAVLRSQPSETLAKIVAVELAEIDEYFMAGLSRIGSDATR